MPTHIAPEAKRFNLRSHFRHLRSGDGQHYYKFLLLALMASLILSPVLSGWLFGRIVELVVILGILTAGFLVVRGKTFDSIFAVAMGAIMLSADLLRLLGHEQRWFTLAWLGSGAIFFSHVTFVLSQDIFTTRETITSGRLYGAVSVYLLLGLLFANLHYGLETIAPGSYQCGSPQCTDEYKPPIYIYFSFITLCSVGYGDILPATRVAGMLAYLEAITGQMYVAILVARLVGMHLSESKA